ncbi:hypothetical protein RRG08_004779 [Elysia crispata]|uniref:Uncharacterized protein n=1 Tax=Elysia crispata TaxID=231223 RepID=A0AAE1AIL0_9GAST|nr:hypothetical protein RRG08_004779 [Elysia crispata]
MTDTEVCKSEPSHVSGHHSGRYRPARVLLEETHVNSQDLICFSRLFVRPNQRGKIAHRLRVFLSRWQGPPQLRVDTQPGLCA